MWNPVRLHSASIRSFFDISYMCSMLNSFQKCAPLLWVSKHSGWNSILQKMYIYTPFTLTCNLFKINFVSVALDVRAKKKESPFHAALISHLIHNIEIRLCADFDFINIKRWTILNWRSIQVTASMSVDLLLSTFSCLLLFFLFLFIKFTIFITHTVEMFARDIQSFLHAFHMLVHLSQVNNNGVNCIWSIFHFFFRANFALQCVVYTESSTEFSWWDLMYAFHKTRWLVSIGNTFKVTALLQLKWCQWNEKLQLTATISNMHSCADNESIKKNFTLQHFC